MKKILALLLCIVLAFTVVGCGKDKVEDGQQVTSEQSVNNDENASEQEKEPVIIEGVGTQEEFVDMINEFNTTEDPAKKEELGKIIQEVLERAEAATEAAE